MGKKFKFDIKTAGITALACATLWAGATYLPQVMDLMRPAKIPAVSQSLEQKPGKTYAILANTSGPNETHRFSEQNSIYSMLSLYSFYKHFKEEGISDENITLLMYNPTNIDVFKTKEYQSLLEKKLFSNVLPSEIDKPEIDKGIDGKATKKNFLDVIHNLHLNSNDKAYIVIFNPSPKGQDENRYTTTSSILEFDKEIVRGDEMHSLTSSKVGKIIIILNNGDASDFSNYFNNNGYDYQIPPKRNTNALTIDSPIGYGFDKETFIMQLLSKSLMNKKYSAREILNDFKGSKVIYFDGEEKSYLECPSLDEPLFPIKE
jgi:hypothetical protein